MKQKHIAILVALASLFGSSVAYSAQITGKVTDSNGVTPMANVPVNLYKYNPRTGNFDYNASATTNAAGVFAAIPQPSNAPASHPGGYYVIFGNRYVYYGDPFYWYDFYSENSLTGYYLETYDDVTELTPTRAPKLVVITTATQSVPLNLVKLNRRMKGCVITGPITINGVPYSSFSAYGNGPRLPATGGALNISFKVRNLGATPISTTAQLLAFLGHPDPALKSNRGITTRTSKAVTLPANATISVTLNTTIPASFMTATPPQSYYYSNPPSDWVFNIGINAVANDGLPNCFSFTTLPVLKKTSSSADLLEGQALETAPDPLHEAKIPLVLSKEGQPIEWGPRP